MYGKLIKAGVLAVMVAGLLAFASPARAASVANGNFETGNLNGWTTFEQPGGAGIWLAYSSTSTIPTTCAGISRPAAPPQGTFAATSSQNGPNSSILYQDVSLEPNTRHSLSFSLYYNNTATSFVTPSTLSYTSPPNQQYRVDVMRPGAPVDSVADADVLARVFRTEVGAPLVRAPAPVTFDLSPYAGQTVRLRFAQVATINCFSGSVDDVKITSTPIDTIKPTIKFLSPKTTTDNTPVIRALVFDGQGADLRKENIRLLVDGRRKSFTYNATSNLLVHRSARLQDGRHRIKIVAADPDGPDRTLARVLNIR